MVSAVTPGPGTPLALGAPLVAPGSAAVVAQPARARSRATAAAAVRVVLRNAVIGCFCLQLVSRQVFPDGRTLAYIVRNEKGVRPAEHRLRAATTGEHP